MKDTEVEECFSGMYWCLPTGNLPKDTMCSGDRFSQEKGCIVLDAERRSKDQLHPQVPGGDASPQWSCKRVRTEIIPFWTGYTQYIPDYWYGSSALGT